jgi:ribonuclease III
MEAARAFVRTFVLPTEGYPDDDGAALLLSVADFRSALQELTQARKLPAPEYALISECGPGHSKTFTMEVRVGREWVSRAEGYTKKVAAQKAAREIYEKLAEPGKQA